MLNTSQTLQIVGQGIAGTLTAWECQKRGIRFRVHDMGHAFGSTAMAAGLINPVTGRRYVKTWLADDIWPIALQTYGELEVFLGVKLIYPLRMMRFLQHAGEENDFSARMLQPEYQHLLSIGDWPTVLDDKIPRPFSCGFVHQVYRVDVALLLSRFRAWLVSADLLSTERFDAATNTAEQVVFCEGNHVVQNDIFDYAAWSPNKGEALLVRILGLPDNLVLKVGSINIIPMSDDIFWVGTKNQWTPSDAMPTVSACEYLTEVLQKTLLCPFEVIDHVAGIRPSVRDRRPVVGAHPILPNRYIINGFGTKGVSLAPFFVAAFFSSHTDRFPEIAPTRFDAK